MKDTRRSRAWILAAVCAVAVTAGLASRAAVARRARSVPAPLAGEELRDAVAAPAAARVGGKTVPGPWFKTPDSRRADLDSALLASRRRRALAARRLAVQ